MPSVATTQVEHFSIDRHHEHKLTRRFERSSSRALRHEQEEDEQVYESYYERRPAASGPAKSNQRRYARPAAATTTTPTNGQTFNIQLNGSNSNPVSPQRVRLIETNGTHSGSSSQRESRSSLVGGHSNGTRIGRFVNYYPASRRPSPSGRRQPNPYAFHVPTSQTLPANNQRDLHHYSSQYELIGSAQQPVESQLSGEPLAPSTRQSSYGFVAPLDRVESTMMRPQRFNKSLRSRTISHLPSMVQVSILEDDKHDEIHQQRSPCGNDLLKAHVVVWRSDAQLEQDNPFRPGTQLSWEAELMVRLIQRGYPMDRLPSLVEAAKVEASSRPNAFKPIPNSKSMSQLTRPAATSKWSDSIDSKAIWADSFKRAKSVPRFEGSKRDGDSIDRLITSIELDVQHRMGSAQAGSGRESQRESIESEKSNKGALVGKFQPPLGSSPTRAKKTKSSPIRERNQQQQAQAEPVRLKSQFNKQQEGQLIGSLEMKKQTEAKQMAVVKQKKRRCCTIH